MNQEHEREIGLLPKKWRKLRLSLKHLKFIEFHQIFLSWKKQLFIQERSMIKSGRREKKKDKKKKDKKGEIAKEMQN